jgi:hypothetical protein
MTPLKELALAEKSTGAARLKPHVMRRLRRRARAYAAEGARDGAPTPKLGMSDKQTKYIRLYMAACGVTPTRAAAQTVREGTAHVAGFRPGYADWRRRNGRVRFGTLAMMKRFLVQRGKYILGREMPGWLTRGARS